MTAVSQPLARFVADLRFADLPPDVPNRAKMLARDLAGSIVRAGKDGDVGPSVLAAIDRLGLGGPGVAHVVGSGRALPPPVAALVNGVLGHALDFDDTHADSSLHPSAPVVPAALAVGEAVGASGRDVVLAIVAGYEVCCRLGMALDPASHYARGFHPTATAGTFGAAAAAAKLYGLDEAGILAAFGVAGSQAAGSLQFLENGAWNKPWQVGQAAMNGVIAAALAAEGFRGAREPIEGRHGLFAGYTDAAAPDKAVAGLGTVFETLRIGMKPYPGCRYTHAALDGLAALRREEGLTPENVSAVAIGLHRNGMRLVGEPIEAKRHAASVVDGQFSMPFCGAVMIATGSFGWDDYARLRDPTIEAIARRIDVRRDESLEGLRHPFGATLEVIVGERRLVRRIADPSGEPGTFPADAAMRGKFMALAEPVLGPKAAALADWFAALDEQTALSRMPAA